MHFFYCFYMGLGIQSVVKMRREIYENRMIRLEKNRKNKKERECKRDLRNGYFSGLEKSGKECIDIGVEDFSKGNKF